MDDNSNSRASPVNEKCHELEAWFGLSYSQFLTIPRLVMQSMPLEWQTRMACILHELDETFDWLPKEGSYWVRMRDAQGRYSAPDHSDYRHGSVEHLRRPMAAEQEQEQRAFPFDQAFEDFSQEYYQPHRWAIGKGDNKIIIYYKYQSDLTRVVKECVINYRGYPVEHRFFGPMAPLGGFANE